MDHFPVELSGPQRSRYNAGVLELRFGRKAKEGLQLLLVVDRVQPVVMSSAEPSRVESRGAQGKGLQPSLAVVWESNLIIPKATD